MRLSRMGFAWSAMLLAGAFWTAGGSSARAAAADRCDRECLVGLMDGYLAALVAHDPARLGTTPDVKFTENTNRMALGDGLWQTITELGTFKLYVEDADDHQAAFYGTVKENGVLALLGVRLKEQGRKVSELETLVVRKASGIHGTFEALEKADSAWEQPAPAPGRSSRPQLINAANQYFNGIEQSTGAIVPFADDCVRIENGAQTAPKAATTTGPTMTCRALFDTKIYNYIHEVTNRRFLVVDPERGLVVAFGMFQHPGNIRPPQLQLDSGGQPRQFPLSTYPNTTQIMEVFQVRGGQIHNIFAYIGLAPYRQSPGW